MLLPFLLTILVLSNSQTITAQLELTQYSPLTFVLTFSEPVAVPSFQLLLNMYLLLQPTFVPNPPPSSATSFIFTAVNAYSTTLQSYSVQFIRPLSIGGGRLSLEFYVVQATKTGVYEQYSDVLSVFIVMASYLMIYFTTLGHIVIQFLQIYCLFMYHDAMKTSLYEKMSQGLLMLNPDLIRKSGGGSPADYIAIIFPPCLIILTGGLGYFLRHKYRGEMSLIKRIFYQVAVYNLFICAVVVFIFPLFFNSLQLFSLIREGSVKNSAFRAIGGIAAYFSLILTISVLYLLVYSINPKFGQSESSWKTYVQSEAFYNYRKLYEGLRLNSWEKRNKIIFTTVKRLLAALLFFWSSGFEAGIFFLQFCTVFYVFTLRPYKAEIYLNSAVLCRLSIFCFYGTVVLANLYFSLGDLTINFVLVQKYLQVTLVVFLGIIIFIFLFIFYECYLKCGDLYRIKLVKEQDEYRFRLVEKERVQSQHHSKRKVNRSIDWSDANRSYRKSKQKGDVPLSIHKNSADIDQNDLQEKVNRNRSPYRRESNDSAPNTSRRPIEKERIFSRRWKKNNMLNEILRT